MFNGLGALSRFSRCYTSVVQCFAVCCTVLQCVAVCLYNGVEALSRLLCYYTSVLQCAAVSSSVLQCVVVCCSVLQCAVVCSICMTRLIHTCDTTDLYVWCDMTHSCDLHEAFTWHAWVNNMCGTAHLYDVTCLICTTYMTHPYGIPDSFICVVPLICMTWHDSCIWRVWLSTLQHTATHCNTLQHTVKHTTTHCNTLQHAVCMKWHDWCIWRVWLNTLQHTATHCNTLQHTVTHYNTLRHTATRDLYEVKLQMYMTYLTHPYDMSWLIDIFGTTTLCDATWLFHMTYMSHGCVWYHSFCETWHDSLIYLVPLTCIMRHDSFIWQRWQDTWAMTRHLTWHDDNDDNESWLIHMTHWYDMRHDSFIWHDSLIRVTRLIFTCTAFKWSLISESCHVTYMSHVTRKNHWSYISQVMSFHVPHPVKSYV